MIDRSDLPVTTQTHTSCLNNIPSRLVSWLYGKLVSIAEAVKRVFTRGNVGQSESLPEAKPLAERTSSEASAKITFLHVPDPQVTAPSQEVELDKAANRPLPELNGDQVLCLSRDAKTILDDMKTTIETLRKEKLSKIAEGKQIAEHLEKLRKGESSDLSPLSVWHYKLLASQQIVYPPDIQESKLIYRLIDCNQAQMETLAQFVANTETFINRVDKETLPSVDKLISSLAKKYPVSCTDLASEEDITKLQENADFIRELFELSFESVFRKEIGLNGVVSGKSFEISEKLHNLTQTLQI